MPKEHRFNPLSFWVDPDKKINLAKRPTKAGKELDVKELAAEALTQDVSDLCEQQELLYAVLVHR